MNDLSDEQIGRFHADGVILLKSLLDHDQVAGCFDAWRWSTEHPGPLASGLLPGTKNAFQDLCNPDSLAVYQGIIQSSPLPDVARQLWGGSPVWYMYEQVFR